MHQCLLPLLQRQRIIRNIVFADMTTRLLGKMGEGGHYGFFADGIRIPTIGIFTTKSREFTYGPQESFIGIFRRCHLG
ncbi:hypothetical protein CDAIGKPJ_02036 [Aeromonas salmonicida]